MDLRRELSRGFQDQDVSRRKPATACTSAAAEEQQALEEREGECGCLSGACDGRACYVTAEEGQGDARGL